jgi:hypothetical protein
MFKEIIFFSILASVWGELDTTFDGLYSYPVDSCYSYGFDLNRVCRLTKNNGDYFADVVEVKSRIKSCPSKYLTNTKDKIEPLNCLFYNGYSFIFYRIGSNINIIKGYYGKTFKNTMGIVGIYFDHAINKLYGLNDKGKFLLIDLEILSNYWDQTDKLDFKETNFIFKNITDLMIFNNTIYFIKDFYCFKQSVFNENVDYMGYHNGDKFDMVIFPLVNLDNYKTGNSLVLPEMPTKDKGFVYLFTYTLTLSMVIFVFFVLRYMQQKLNGNGVLANHPLIRGGGTVVHA